MSDRVHYHPNLIYSVGTQVVALVEILGQNGKILHPRGSVGVVARSPNDLEHPYGVPDQLENDATQEAYWELQKFLVLALKANPNVLECLYTPMVEKATPLAEKLLGMRAMFLSRMVYQTYNGYVLSQFKKMQPDFRNQGQVKWKHVMHLIRLLLSGISIMREGFVPVRVSGSNLQQFLDFVLRW